MEGFEAGSHVCLEVDPKYDLAPFGLKRQVEVTCAAKKNDTTYTKTAAAAPGPVALETPMAVPSKDEVDISTSATFAPFLLTDGTVW